MWQLSNKDLVDGLEALALGKFEVAAKTLLGDRKMWLLLR
jgi:hypothetical protein